MEKTDLKEVEDETVILAYLEILRIATEEQDMDEMDRIMALLEEFSYPNEIQSNIEELSAFVINMDSEQALEIIKVLTNQWKSSVNGRA